MILFAAVALTSIAYLERRQPGAPTVFGTGETGSGFVIASDARESYVLTAAHVLGCDTYGSGCADTIELRFPDDPGHVWQAERAYSGAALAANDLAVVVVRRGMLPALRVASAQRGESVAVLGFPQSLVSAAAGTNPLQLHPRTLSGAAGESLSDGRLLLDLSSEKGDSGAPVVDQNGDVVAVLQGKNDATHDIAVSGQDLRDLVSLVTNAVATHAGSATRDDAERERAYLLLTNANAWESIRTRYYGIGGTTEIQQNEDADFSIAVEAGSLDAARTFLRTFPVRSAIYTPSTAVAHSALALARAAADRGDAAAAYDVHTFLQFLSGEARDATQRTAVTALSSKYFNLAVAGGYPYALLELSGAKTDPAYFVPLQQRAMKAFLPLIARGDADAAYQYASLYALAPKAPPDFGAHDTATPENFMRAVQLGSTKAVPFLLIYRNQLPNPAEALQIAEVAAGHNWMVARNLADVYAGDGFPQDSLHALDLYAHSYMESTFQPILNRLVPSVAAAYAHIDSSAAFATASHALAFVAANNSTDSGDGITVYSDSTHTIVAISSSFLHCDAFEEHCRTPAFVRFDGAADKKEYIPSIAYTSGNTLEYGVALLDVPAPNEPAVAVARAPGPLLFTIDASRKHAYVGILRGVDDDGHVVRFDVPWDGLSFSNALFDVASGDLVGLANDPTDLTHATGPAAIRAALHAIGK